MRILIFICVILIPSTLSNAQPTPQSSSDSLLYSISKQLNGFETSLKDANKKLKTIDNNTNDSYFTEAFKNYTFSLIYELFGYKKDTKTNPISRLISIISLLFLIIRIYFYFSKRHRNKLFVKFLNFYLIFLAFLTLLLPWLSVILPNKDVDKTIIARTKKSVKELNDEIKVIKDADFTKTIASIQYIEKLNIDTIRLANEKSIKNLNERFSILSDSIHKKVSLLQTDIEFLRSKMEKNNLSGFARSKAQKLQTWIIVLSFLILLATMLLLNKK